ncbi:tRNA (cytidine/uridine-2'-O-)-methyltransferase [Methylomarinovum caldicuralii]|uniref:tRNA (cytidine(34)-2'-O)-methyltransferase n=1 Tax=Methylomarinovum caldicuralii TaxID=438856 RepID=A0AAU9CMN9_9GAMM|nr:tRNA (cytidine(34)-2'-O)-methyltransferase [Methylomarinovum caldicuralii]BCX81158.1 tRNA (cytidine/uridine-2'-O-)-methyltransferase [Methylomarinovum caldicuralii]
MFDVVLLEPEIAPNTGNVIRLCANTGCRLHLIEPLGFDLEERKLRRAGLDYHDLTVVRVHRSYAAFLDAVAPHRIFAFTTKARRRHTQAAFEPGDALLFGPETRGLPPALLETFPEGRRLRLPMVPSSRSLNLSNAVAVAVYEAWRQQGFGGAC